MSAYLSSPVRAYFREQLHDGGKCPSKNCVPCALAMLAYRASVGRYNLSGPAIRDEANASCFTGTGGVGYLAGATAVSNLTNGNVKLTVRNTAPWVLRDYVTQGRAAVVSISYAVILGEPCACDNDFPGGHAVMLNEFRVKDGQPQYLMGDPLCDGRGSYPKGWQWVPAKLIHEAALARTGGHGINYVLSQDTERIRRRARLASPVYARPRPNATVLGKLRYNVEYFVQATVTGGEFAPNRVGYHRIPFGGRTGYAPGPALA